MSVLEIQSEFVDTVSDLLEKQPPPPEEKFADLFENYDGQDENLQIGDRVEGEIVSIGMDDVFVSTGVKIDGAVAKSELLNEKGSLSCKVGDTLDLFVIAVDDNEIRLSRALSGKGGLHLLHEARQQDIPVEGKVTQQCKGGFEVEIMQHRSFCPISQIDLQYVEDPQPYVGQTFQFIITRIEENGRNIIVSRRDLLQKEQAKIIAEFLKKISIDDQMEGRINNIMKFGAFVELIPGVEGLVHISELGWSRTNHPDEVVNIGDKVMVKIIAIDQENQKIGLSMKQVMGDPWETDLNFHEGDIVKARIKRCAPFGAFAEITPGIEGLIHISEMSFSKRVNRAEELVKIGEEVDVQVKEIDLSRRRVALSLRGAQGDPWLEVQEKFPPGSRVAGTLERKEKFGYFINLTEGVTGLMPISKIKSSAQSRTLLKMSTGSVLTVVVEAIKMQERKISLKPADAETNNQKTETDWHKYSRPVKETSTQSLGSLGEKLQAALKKSGKLL